ncbi:hypothetical protein ACNOYE_25260 [Nannocystaceae bacterium ST9]
MQRAAIVSLFSLMLAGVVAALACREDPPIATGSTAESGDSDSAADDSLGEPSLDLAGERPDHLPGRADELYDPFATARASIGQIDNREAPIPPQCYTKTEARYNPCWVCHAPAHYPNVMADWDLQGSYEFSDEGKSNYWTNLFVDRSEAIAAISDAAILAWIREDNYAPLRASVAAIAADDYQGYRPDLEFAAGFDAQGFANDGSHWRAFTYKPFPGAFWPTNGSTDDVMIRLPAEFRQTAAGVESRAIYQLNLAILEASMASDLDVPDAAVVWTVEPIDETLAGVDLDGDGQLEPAVTSIHGLPSHHVGAAADRPVRRGLYPEGTEFLHSVRYVDPEHGISVRMKELRYSKKVEELDKWAILAAYADEADEKDEGKLPVYPGSPLVGLRNPFGWQLQGFIEDERGRLRAQTHEEHYFCMGCHSTIGSTADQTFAFARKRPGAPGWRHQDLSGMPDVPQAGHARGEVAEYLERVGAGDEFRANQEMIERFFDAEGQLDEAAVAAASIDLADMLVPSPARALLLDKAYLVIVREQSFTRGRDAVLAPVSNVHATITDESTGLAQAGKLHADGTLRLDWSAAP